MNANKSIIGIVATNSIDFVETVFACWDEGNSIVWLRNKSDSERIAITDVTSVIEPKNKYGWFTPVSNNRSDNTVAQVSFTSGTEGMPKGVILTHEALKDVIHRLNSVMEVDSTIREYIGVPVNYSFGFGRCRAIAAVGGKLFLPEHGFNPLEIRKMLSSGTINAFSAVPSLVRVLLDHADLFGSEANKLKWIEIGSQYMSRGEKEQLKILFPNAVIVQHYGLTEASRTTFLRIDKVRGEHLESVGQVYGDSKVDISDSGHIRIKGSHVAKEIIRDGTVSSNVGASGWFETSDNGIIQDGFVYFKGRSDDVINCGGIKLSPDVLETEILEELQVGDRIVVAKIPHKMIGEGVLVVQLKEGMIDRVKLNNAVLKVLQKYGINNRGALTVAEVDTFPLTDTGKIKRKELSEHFSHLDKNVVCDDALATSSCGITDEDLSEDEQKIKELWESVLGYTVESVDDTFYDMGGDSLTSIAVMVKMEKLGISVSIAQGILQGQTVREMAAQLSKSMPEKKRREYIPGTLAMKASLSINFVRGLLVLCVVCGHWSLGVFDRLPSFVEFIKPFSAPFFSAGTPGFSIIYGVSAGYSLFDVFKKDAGRLIGILKNTFLFLAAGIFILAAVRCLDRFLAGGSMGITDITNSFYSVLSYYLLITISIYLIFKFIANRANKSMVCVYIATVSYAFYYFILLDLTKISTVGFLELLKLLVSAKYSYFNMLVGTMTGMAVGLEMRNKVDAKESLTDYRPVAVVLISIGILFSAHMGQLHSWLVWPGGYVFLWKWLFYAGVVVGVLSFMNSIIDNYKHQSWFFKKVVQLTATTGVLAFPIFILHELVLPAKKIITNFSSVSDGSALVVVLCGFFLICGLFFVRVYKLNFGFQR